MEISIEGIIGLYGGMLFGLFGWWFGRRSALKKRGLDELYELIWQKARSYSWYATLVTIYVFFSLVVFGFELSVVMVMGILLIVHLGSWGIAGAILSVNMYSEAPFKLSRVVVGLSVSGIAVIIFTVTTIATADWRFILMGVPFVLFSVVYALPAKKVTD